MWKGNLTLTQPGFVDTYLHTLALSHTDSGVMLPAGWVLRQRRATGDRLERGDGSLSLITQGNVVWGTWPSDLSLCVCMLAYLYLLVHVCLRAAIIRAYRPQWGWRRGARAGLGHLTGAGVEWGGRACSLCNIQILMGAAIHNQRNYSIHWTPSIP